MATYDVIAVGFIDGILHTPTHKRRNVVITDKPFKKAPSWLKLRDSKQLTPAQKSAATKALRKAEDEAIKAVADNKKEIGDATFMAVGKGAVESL